MHGIPVDALPAVIAPIKNAEHSVILGRRGP